MITPMRLSCIAFACLRRETAVTSSSALQSRTTATRLFSESLQNNPNDLPSFPRWLRLAAFAPVSQRHDLTTKVADKINNKSGGFVSNASLLSDMVTAILMEDIEPDKITHFWNSLEELDTLEWSESSKEQVELCQQLLSDSSSKVPQTIAGVLQLTWRGAEGKLRHEIPADG